MNAAPNRLRLLAALLAQPEEDALELLRELLPQAPWLSSAIAELAATPLEHWQAEHTRLFINGYPSTPCPPFESAYRQGQMGGTAACDLAGLYRRAGLRAREAPADYLGTLLDFAAYLEGREDLAGLREQLYRDHMEHWVPRFAQELQNHACLVLYRLLGEQLAALFVTTDVPG